MALNPIVTFALFTAKQITGFFSRRPLIKKEMKIMFRLGVAMPRMSKFVQNH